MGAVTAEYMRQWRAAKARKQYARTCPNEACGVNFVVMAKDGPRFCPYCGQDIHNVKARDRGKPALQAWTCARCQKTELRKADKRRAKMHDACRNEWRSEQFKAGKSPLMGWLKWRQEHAAAKKSHGQHG